MKISLCTISFRHQLIGLKDIAFWPATTGFRGLSCGACTPAASRRWPFTMLSGWQRRACRFQ